MFYYYFEIQDRILIEAKDVHILQVWFPPYADRVWRVGNILPVIYRKLRTEGLV